MPGTRQHRLHRPPPPPRGVELVFQRVPGVVQTAVGYSQGRTKNPTYQEVGPMPLPPHFCCLRCGTMPALWCWLKGGASRCTRLPTLPSRVRSASQVQPHHTGGATDLTPQMMPRRCAPAPPGTTRWCRSCTRRQRCEASGCESSHLLPDTGREGQLAGFLTQQPSDKPTLHRWQLPLVLHGAPLAICPRARCGWPWLSNAHVCQPQHLLRALPRLQVSFDQLLDVFWSKHDPTTPNRQGNDVGEQYR